MPESHRDAGFEQGFSSSELGHFRTLMAEFRLCHDQSHTVIGGGTAAGRQWAVPGWRPPRARWGPRPVPRGGNDDRPDALVCGGQRAVWPALARAIGSAGERLVHTEEVTGSIPVSPTRSEAGCEPRPAFNDL